ncbi:MAG: DUF1828 domain-containing protein [Schleiferilactobacillus harbinensis]|jgi:hypothetical protein|nr:DUF1828 domain-containing protein [Schleiferilactobacillus harbinensis]MCI1911482.1 DUF1828 domain-containing protein [Schleiferilactobacillus harbinensis]
MGLENEEWIPDPYYRDRSAHIDEITTPFTDPLGDNIRFFVVPLTNGQIYLTDDGNTILDLTMQHPEYDYHELAQRYQNIASQHQLFLSADGVLGIVGTNKQVALLAGKMIQVIRKINELW